MLPASLSAAPSILSLIDDFGLVDAAGARFLVTAPVAVFFFLPAALVPAVVLRFRTGSVLTVGNTLGLELPVVPRVCAIVLVGDCIFGGEMGLRCSRLCQLDRFSVSQGCWVGGCV